MAPKSGPKKGSVHKAEHTNRSSAYLTAMHSTHLMTNKTTLPAEIIDMILDHLPPPELIKCARVSKQMREMVYDDARWVMRLKSMGCWNELEARKRAGLLRQKGSSPTGREPEEHKKTASGLANGIHGTTGNVGRRKDGATLFDAALETPSPTKSQNTERDLANGFQAIALSPDAPTAGDRGSQASSILDIFANVRSMRGAVRQEYGKIHKALAPFYYDLTKCSNHNDALLFKEITDPAEQARLLSELRIFAKGDYSQGWWQRVDAIDSVIALFENAALREFEQGLEADDVNGRMRQYAHVLVTLNGGAAAIDLFIQNSQIMQSPYLLGNPQECLHTAMMGDVNLKPSHEFFQRILSSLQTTCSKIDTVFPPSVDVFIPFLDRMSDRVIIPYITPIFDEAHEANKESYLKAVSGIYEQSAVFASSLKPTRGSKPNFSDEARKIINTSFDRHVDLYLREEYDFFCEKSAAEVDRWERQLSEREESAESFYMSNINRQAVKQDFLTSFRKVLMMPVNVLPTFSTSKPSTTEKLSTQEASRASTPNAAEELGNRGSISPRPEAPTTELAAKMAIMNSKLEGIASLFSIEVALTLVHLAKSALERISRFVDFQGQVGVQAKEECKAAFVELIRVLGFRHIQAGFDKAIGHLSSYNAREATSHDTSVRPLVTFLELVNVGDLIQQMIDVFYVQELANSKLVDRDDFLDPANKDKKRFEQMLDERVASGLNKGIDALIDEVEYTLATLQPATDYNPGVAGTDENAVLDIGPTIAAGQVKDMVSSATGMLVGSTDKNVLDVFNQEVGVRLFTSLCKHLKRQRINQTGAIKLISDTNLYFEYISTLKNKELLRYFQALRELSQIFLVDGTHSKELATIIADNDRYYGIFRAEEVYEYAERRADWFTIRKSVEKAMYGVGCLIM